MQSPHKGNRLKLLRIKNLDNYYISVTIKSAKNGILPLAFTGAYCNARLHKQLFTLNAWQIDYQAFFVLE